MKLTRLFNLLLTLALLLGNVPITRTAESPYVADDIETTAAPFNTLGTSSMESGNRDMPTPQAAIDAIRGAPLLFIENVGQFADGARFQVRGGDHTLWLADDALWITLLEPGDEGETAGDITPSSQNLESQIQNRKGVNVKLSFPGANSHPLLEPFNRLDTHTSSFTGSNPTNWHADVPVWGGVRYVDLYPGIDLEVTSENGRLVQRLVACDGADLHIVRLQVEGADRIALDDDRLRVGTEVAEFTIPLLQAVSAEGTPLPLSGERPNLVLSEAEGVKINQVTSPFSSVPWPSSLTAPQDNSDDLLYATFLGGNGDDAAGGIAVDADQAVYVVGWTYSSDFPVTPGAFNTSPNGGQDIVVVKLNACALDLAYATFLGGSGLDGSFSIEVDASGAAYITGWTHSSDFPTTPDAFDTSYNGARDVVAIKLNASGSDLVYATFLGGGSDDNSITIDLDENGAVYVAGTTSSSDFPTTPDAFDTTFNGNRDVFVVKLNINGSALDYATFLGHNSYEEGFDVAADASGAAYVTGWTYSSGFPTTPGAFDTNHNGDIDAFVVKLNSEGSALDYATFLGGSNREIGASIAIDDIGQAYVTGVTNSSNFPTTSEAFDITHNGGQDLFMVKLNSSGSDLQYATFVGGSQDDGGWGSGPNVSLSSTVDENGVAYVTGVTTSSDFPATPGAFDRTFNGSYDAFVAKLDASGSYLTYATFLGGSNGDFGSFGIAVDSNRVVYVTGRTDSADFPVTVGAFDTGHNGGGNDIFVAKLLMGDGGDGPDFCVSHIEVTQAIQDLKQDLKNSVPLIAGKRAFARVHVRNQGTPSLAPVTAQLCKSSDCLAPRNSGGHIQVLAGPDRASLDQSFYFELPSDEWLDGSFILTAKVNPAGPQHVEENNTVNNSLSQRVSFGGVPPLKVKLFGIRFREPAGQGQWYEPREVDYDLIISWLERAYPVAEVRTDQYVIGNLEGKPKPREVNKILLALRTLDLSSGAIDSQTRYYGIIDDGVGGDVGGLAVDIPSFVASGSSGDPLGSRFPWDNDESYGDWFAGHELGHAYGQVHVQGIQPPPCGDCDSDACRRDPCGCEGGAQRVYPNGIIGGPITDTTRYYGFDIESETVYTPTGWHDVMTYCSHKWISDSTYKGIRDHLVTPRLLAAQDAVSIGEHLIVLGTINHTQNTAELHTLYRIPDTTAPALPISGTHRLKLLGTGDIVLADYPIQPGKDTDTQAGEDETGLIGEIVPWITGTQRVAVYSGTLELASRLVSTSTPAVTVQVLDGSLVLTDTAIVSWAATDADQDPLTYALQYSVDDGATWQAVGVGITSTMSYTLDLTLLPGTDQGRVRVLASDGVNTGIDTSDEMFHVAPKPPQARILSPAPGNTFLLEQTFNLVGEGTDLEDGTLDDSALSWQSSLSGTLGAGRMLAVTGLPVGTQIISLTVTDSDSNTATATVEVTITIGLAFSVTKTVAPQDQVSYGDELTYTLVVSAPLGVRLGIYDLLDGTEFTRFVEQPMGVTHIDGIITGTLTFTPTNQVTVSFVTQVDVPGVAGLMVDVTNRTCVYLFDWTLGGCVWSNEVTNSASRFYNIGVEKSVTPQGQVEYGDTLTYTLTISSTPPGAQLTLYDSLTDTTFIRFVEHPPGVIHSDGVITGPLTITPTNQITVSFAARVDVPGTAGLTATVTNHACIYPLDGTLGNCVWSNEATNPIFRSYKIIYLPVVLRSYSPHK